MFRKCSMFRCGGLLHPIAIITNLLVILFVLFIIGTSYGDDRIFALLLAIPPVISIMALRRNGDKEERLLKKRIRKAHLRRELKELEEFDTSK